ncbi:Signal transduction response regulator, receiver domain histidine kinase, HD-GYP domain-containing [Desulfonema limicola]|uniref:Signal transduction response regulator, receiver domain histidine kinase, HD-GYP domain-containing n=1 Tax=Desulfonema limicola TaxID=45656 RepID=A0A975BCS9_9BACT|nr:HD domain-containing phosphohydrolase [Desulfonema limicola]QTA82997.1 Signal transduction response regulator, receiver domain histidine kinase, HD-GYP domain-containing [Desulfonema limicola]
MDILIAEDDAITRHRLQKFLQKWGHKVTACPDGLEALEKFFSDNMDMVITDWMMPEMEGPELVRKIRQSLKPFVYIILLTSRGDKSDVITGLFDIGADDYIIKPFDPDELQARISVGERTVRLERSLREYSQGLEKIVRHQTKMIRETQEETILKLLTALESRDQETGGHVRRISLFCTVLAEAAGWSKSQVDDLRLASPMHDIGKIGVPDKILRKPGPLTSAEFDVIKTHTTTGGKILGNSDFPMLKMAHDIALFHHERWDGSGYPEGLKGDIIPEAARITSVVDVFDALSNDRVYRKASPEQEVLEIMYAGRGSHFDPNFYDLFICKLGEFRRILKENP